MVSEHVNNAFKMAFNHLHRVCSGLVVSVQDCQSRGSGFKSQPSQKFDSRFLLYLCLPANSAMAMTLRVHSQPKDKMVRERTGHPPLIVPHIPRLRESSR